jgi:hypothetical protein
MSSLLEQAKTVTVTPTVVTRPFDPTRWEELAAAIEAKYGDDIVLNEAAIKGGGVMADGSPRAPFAVKQAPHLDRTNRFNIVLWVSRGSAVYTNCDPIELPEAA